jgi:hypothetical protein
VIGLAALCDQRTTVRPKDAGQQQASRGASELLVL